MYGLKQAGHISHIDLITNLKGYVYHPEHTVPWLWSNFTRSLKFILISDDFRIHYINTTNTNHLINLLKLNYPITINWKGDNYCGLDIKWNLTYTKSQVSISKLLTRLYLQTKHNKKSSHCPHKQSQHSLIPQKPQHHGMSSPLNDSQHTYLWSYIGPLLYYDYKVDPTILHETKNITTSIEKSTIDKLNNLNHRLN